VPDALSGFFSKGKEKVLTKSPLKVPVHDASGQDEEKTSERVHDDDGFTYIDDHEDTTLFAPRPEMHEEVKKKPAAKPTVSQKAMPPPIVKSRSPPRKPTHREPARAAVLPSVVKEQSASTDSSTRKESVLPQKRATGDLIPDSVPTKRARHSDESEVVNNTANEDETEFQKVFTKSQKSIQPKEAGRPLAEVVNAVSRKPSHGSQRVDIHGSPVPQGMVVDEKVTVLETYSQQVDMSSDTPLVETIVARKSNEHGKPDRIEDDNVIPPSAQPQPRSRNIKFLPAPPEAQSRAITAFGRTEGGRLIVEDEAERLNTDPFTSTEAAPHASRTSSSSNFVEQLRRKEPQQQLLNHTKQRLEYSDPDKTLVEPEPLFVKERSVSQSTVSSSDDSSQESDAVDQKTDMATWRHGLLPHQMNLFDELVNVAHRLVAHLSSSEAAATDVVDDYHRRGLQLVEQMELSHAAQYEKYIDALRDKKQRLREDLEDCARKLKDSTTVVVTAREQRSRQKASGHNTVGNMQQVLVQYC
jgi:hypothetical protein